MAHFLSWDGGTVRNVKSRALELFEGYFRQALDRPEDRHDKRGGRDAMRSVAS